MNLTGDRSKVSIVMSVFGYEEYVQDSIGSVLKQTFKNIEFIIIDDDCGYDLYKIIREFDDKRIVYIKNKKNMGLTKSLLKGINEATGKYIARQDAGNISLANRINIQYNYLENNKDYYLIGSSVILIDENNQEICKIAANSDLDFIRREMPRHNCINHSTIMFRNMGENIYREKFRYSQDYDFYLNLLSRGIVFGNISDILLKERLMPDSITYAKRNEQRTFENFARDFYFERMKHGGRDNYDLLDSGKSIDKSEKSAGKKNNSIYFNRQKAYFLVYSGKLKITREFINGVFKKKFDIKLLLYFLLSYFPFLVRILSKIRKMNLK